MSQFLPYSRPDLGEEEISAVVDTIRSGWVTTGPATAAFENEFAEFVGGDVEAIAVNSATAGLHLALEACGVGEGDEVIVPSWTFTATAEVVRYLNATPVIVDVDKDTLNLDLKSMSAAVNPRTKAIIVVHIGGLSADMPALQAMIRDSNIRVIEDAAHALPSQTNGVFVGSAAYSDAVVFSFYATKTMTTGEGGMITTRNSDIARRVRIMRLHGIDRDVFNRYTSEKPNWAYDVVAPGYKYNLTDPASAMGRVQLARSGEMHLKRQEIAKSYSEAFESLPITLPVPGGHNDTHAWHLYIIRLDSSAPVSRDEFIQEMSLREIGCSVHFIPLHKLSFWRESLDLGSDICPIASSEFLRTVSLPIFSGMTTDDVNRVIRAVREILVL